MSTMLGDFRVLRINAEPEENIAWSACYGQLPQALESQHVGKRISTYEAVAKQIFHSKHACDRIDLVKNMFRPLSHIDQKSQIPQSHFQFSSKQQIQDSEFDGPCSRPQVWVRPEMIQRRISAEP